MRQFSGVREHWMLVVMTAWSWLFPRGGNMGTKEGFWGVQRGVQRVLERYSKGVLGDRCVGCVIMGI